MKLALPLTEIPTTNTSRPLMHVVIAFNGSLATGPITEGGDREGGTLAERPNEISISPEELEEYHRSVVPLQLKDFRQLGAWAKPFHFAPPATPPEPSTPREKSAHLDIIQSA